MQEEGFEPSKALGQQISHSPIETGTHVKQILSLARLTASLLLRTDMLFADWFYKHLTSRLLYYLPEAQRGEPDEDRIENEDGGDVGPQSGQAACYEQAPAGVHHVGHGVPLRQRLEQRRHGRDGVERAAREEHGQYYHLAQAHEAFPGFEYGRY